MSAVSKTDRKIEMKVFPKGQVVIPVLFKKIQH